MWLVSVIGRSHSVGGPDHLYFEQSKNNSVTKARISKSLVSSATELLCKPHKRAAL